MLRHFNRKKKELAEVDPKHVAFWERLFSMSFKTLLESTPGTVSGKSTNGYTNSAHAALTTMFMHEGHNVCVLSKVEVQMRGGEFRATVPRTGDMVTAFYFPLIPGLFEVRLEVGGGWIANWTPEGSEFREYPLPLPMILEECRGLPGLHVDWERILALCREQGDYSLIDHDFSRDIEIEGVPYRRAVLVHPCLALAGLAFHDVHLKMVFQENEGEQFAFYSEYWTLQNETRKFIVETQFEMTSQSDTFENHSNTQRQMAGMMGIRFDNHATISELGSLLKEGANTARAHSNLGALGASGATGRVLSAQ